MEAGDWAEKKKKNKGGGTRAVMEGERKKQRLKGRGKHIFRFPLIEKTPPLLVAFLSVRLSLLNSQRRLLLKNTLRFLSHTHTHTHTHLA